MKVVGTAMSGPGVWSSKLRAKDIFFLVWETDCATEYECVIHYVVLTGYISNLPIHPINLISLELLRTTHLGIPPSSTIFIFPPFLSVPSSFHLHLSLYPRKNKTVSSSANLHVEHKTLAAPDVSD